MTPAEMLDALGYPWRYEVLRRARAFHGLPTLTAGDYYVVSIPGCEQRLTAADVAEFYANEMALR